MSPLHKTHQPAFSSDELFTYDHREKLFSAILLIATGAVILILIGFYLFAWRYSENVVIAGIGSVIGHITSQISSATLLGVFYGSLIGGLFFVFLPTEALFISYLRADHNPFLLILIFLSGFLISYTFNYFIGLKLNRLAKNMIGAKKFYPTKSIINRYGGVGVFAFNALPLPSQPLATILGVFKYNKTRFYLLFLSGQLTKYIIITLIFSFFI